MSPSQAEALLVVRKKRLKSASADLALVLWRGLTYLDEFGLFMVSRIEKVGLFGFWFFFPKNAPFSRADSLQNP